MTEIAQLVDRISAEEDPAAARTLVAAGAEAVPAVAEALRNVQGSAALRLREVLVSIRDPDAVPKLVDLVNDPNMELTIGAFGALGGSRNKGAVQPLVEYATNESNRETRRALAVEALGDLGDGSTKDALDQVAKEAKEQYLPHLFAATVSALAKLGDQSWGSVFARTAQEEDDPTALVHYAKTLKHVVAPGVFDALVGLVERSTDPDTQRDAIRGLQYLGSKESASALVEHGAAESVTTATEALLAFQAVTGAELPEDSAVADAETWWQEHEARLDARVCYRLGRPIRVSDVIELLEKRNVAAVAEELYVITGKRFDGPLVPPEGASVEPKAKAEAWWRTHGGSFEAGRLYKFGHPQDIAVALESPDV